MSRTVIFILISFSFFSFSDKETNNKEAHGSLFKIERSRDADQIFYDLQVVSKDKLDKNNPINIYWVKETEGGKTKPLTWVQQHYAYGLKYTYSSENIAKFHFVSYNKKRFTLKKDKTGKFQVFTKVNEKEVIVNRIFIQIDGGTFWFPKISRVELHGQNPLTNKSLVEIINP